MFGKVLGIALGVILTICSCGASESGVRDRISRASINLTGGAVLLMEITPTITDILFKRGRTELKVELTESTWIKSKEKQNTFLQTLAQKLQDDFSITGFEKFLDELNQSFESKYHSEVLQLKQYLKISPSKQLILEDLKKRKAGADIFGCQLLVENKAASNESLELINDALIYYFNVYKEDTNALKDGPFLYTLMRMLVDHEDALSQKIKAILSTVFSALEINFSEEQHYSNGKKIYDWLYENGEGIIGEYNI